MDESDNIIYIDPTKGLPRTLNQVLDDIISKSKSSMRESKNYKDPVNRKKYMKSKLQNKIYSKKLANGPNPLKEILDEKKTGYDF